MNRAVLILLIAAISACFASNAAVNDDTARTPGFRLIMTDDRGLPLEDGFYDVVFRVYDKPAGGVLIDEMTGVTESKNGICMICDDYLNELSSQGHKQVWISLKIDNYPESPFRTRVFLDRAR